MKLLQKNQINVFSTLFLLSATLAQGGQYVHKHVLENGLTVLVRPVKTTQKVSTQLWFNVGSKHEADDEKGLAHWLEHMCFKGTQKMTETDIRLTTAKLSGNFNASTSYDWTRFFLNFPAQHWFEALPIFADIMSNCTFKQDLLNSEVQVVVQEMKNNRDNYLRQLAMQMIAAAFPDHPYHFPVIGFRSDLESLSRDKLMAFYKKHYIPNNAVLVVVGNVDPNEVLEHAEKQFGNISPNWAYTSRQFTTEEDICAKNIILYRDVQKPSGFIAFRTPGAHESHSIAYEVFKRLIAGGRGSRLYRTLIDQEQLVTSVSMQSLDLFDKDILLLHFEPLGLEAIPSTIELVNQELANIATFGPQLYEVEWAVQKIQSSFYDLMESNYGQAETIAQVYLATHDEDLLFEYIHHDYQKIQHEIKELASTYLRSSVMHTGIVMPLPEQERGAWDRLQAQSNKDDARLLADKKRMSPVEEPRYMHSVTAQEPRVHDLALPEQLTLRNGLKVLYYQNDNVPKLNVTLQFKFDAWYEPKETPGLCSIVSAMLLEGTKTRSQKSLMEELEKNGVGLGAQVGNISMSLLKEQCYKSFELLTDIICNPIFAPENLNKIKQHALASYKRFWDTPSSILSHLIDTHIWGDKLPNSLGTPESIERITPEQLKAFHAQYYSPHGATLVIVGDLRGIHLHALLENTLGTWQGSPVEDSAIELPTPSDAKLITHAIEREQVMLSVAGLSINRFDKDYYALALFNQVLNRKLFSLREQTSAFYSISGSVLSGASHRPGIAHITTQVSQTRVCEAQELILAVIDYLVESFDEHDLVEAQSHIINSLSDQYSTNASIASTFLFLNEYNFAYDYLVTRIPKIKSITVDQVRDAAKRVFNKENMSVFKVGPV